MSMTEKVAYLRGLLEGMDLDKDKKEEVKELMSEDGEGKEQ